MSIVSYKDYQGSVTYVDGMLVVCVLHVDDFLTVECNSASEVEGAFKDLVDDYLETCEELGREPQKSFKGSFNVRVNPDLHRRAAMAATEHDISLNAWVVQAIQEKLAGEDANKKLHLQKVIAAQYRDIPGDLTIAWETGAKTAVLGRFAERPAELLGAEIADRLEGHGHWVDEPEVSMLHGHRYAVAISPKTQN